MVLRCLFFPCQLFLKLSSIKYDVSALFFTATTREREREIESERESERGECVCEREREKKREK